MEPASLNSWIHSTRSDTLRREKRSRKLAITPIFVKSEEQRGGTYQSFETLAALSEVMKVAEDREALSNG